MQTVAAGSGSEGDARPSARPEYEKQPGRVMPDGPRFNAEQIEADEIDLQVGLGGLAAMVTAARSLDSSLAEVAGFAARAIPGAEGAGVTVVRGPGGQPPVQAWAAMVDFVQAIDHLQYEQLGEGPCITCMQTRRAVVSGSLGSDGRWRRFGAQVARMGVHSGLSLPLLIEERVVGAINSYARGRDAFTEHAVVLGTHFANAAAVSVYNMQVLAQARETTERLQRALRTRAVIDQAIGILRSRSGGSADDAFARLRQLSQSENVRLALVAQRLVDEAVRRARARRAQP